MNWLMAIAVAWPAVSVAAGVVIGRAIRLADQPVVRAATPHGNFAVDRLPASL